MGPDYYWKQWDKGGKGKQEEGKKRSFWLPLWPLAFSLDLTEDSLTSSGFGTLISSGDSNRAKWGRIISSRNRIKMVPCTELLSQQTRGDAAGRWPGRGRSQQHDFRGLPESCAAFPCLRFSLGFSSFFFLPPSCLPFRPRSPSAFSGESGTPGLGPFRADYLLLIFPRCKGWRVGKGQGGREGEQTGGGQGGAAGRHEKQLCHPTAGRAGSCGGKCPPRAGNTPGDNSGSQFSYSKKKKVLE